MRRTSLLENPFGTLPVISVWVKGTNPVVYTIPRGLSGLDQMILLLDEICHNYYDDIGENRYYLENMPPPNIDKFNRFQRRETWRVGSFIVFALNLELTLKKKYRNLLNFVLKLNPDVDSVANNLIEKRLEEVEKYKFYRDKVFAHTAFGAPRSDDNLSMQATSLAYLEGRISGITPNGIIFGGAVLGGDGQDRTKFERIKFLKMSSDFKAHFRKWHEMYSDLCTIVQNASDDEIKQHIDNVEMITRSVNDESAS